MVTCKPFYAKYLFIYIRHERRIIWSGERASLVDRQPLEEASHAERAQIEMRPASLMPEAAPRSLSPAISGGQYSFVEGVRRMSASVVTSARGLRRLPRGFRQSVIECGDRQIVTDSQFEIRGVISGECAIRRAREPM